MRLRTFTAADMPSAIKLVKEAMGDNAIILSSEPVNGKSVSVTAAIETYDDEPAPAKPFEPIVSRDRVPDDLRFAIQDLLRFHNLPELFIAKMLQKAADANLASAMAIHRLSQSKEVKKLHQMTMEKLLAVYYRYEPLDFGQRATRLMLIGTPGIGKTLTCAKIATRLALAKQPLAVITTDTKRAGGIEQLQAFTDILGITLQVAHSRTELWKMLKSVPDTQHVIIDTAGCNPFDDKEWMETQAYATIEGIEPVLVLPAGGDSAEAIDNTEIFASLPVRRLLVTRTDTARRFGSILAAAAAHDLALSHASTSSGMAESLHPLSAGMLSELLLRYQSTHR